ncbi:MAG: transposase [Chitinophagales bacterium]|nr:transposase [Chitinophagales bacterium]
MWNSTHPFRCIKKTKSRRRRGAFVCNVEDLNAKEAIELYKQRWDIEVFFKFLNQKLNFSYLISRNKAGI